jgi:hypothetical protein
MFTMCHASRLMTLMVIHIDMLRRRTDIGLWLWILVVLVSAAYLIIVLPISCLH